MKNQLGGLTPKGVTYTGVDSLNLYTIFNNGTVSYKTPGVYFGIYASQIGSPRGNGAGDIHIWSRRNNQDEPNSNSIQTVERGSTSVLVFSTVFQTPVSRQSSVVFSAIVSNPCTALGLIATDFGYEPVVPSIISSEIQLSNLNTPVNYAALTSSQIQLGSPTSRAVTLNVQGDVSGVRTTTTGADGYIEFSESKLYFAIACGQVGRAPNSLAEGEVHLWWQLNQDSIPNSNTIQSTRGGSTAVLVTQGIVSVKANDKLKIMLSSTDSNLGLIASTPANEPAVPSMIFVLFELDGQRKSLPYAQFSSLVSQPGCLTARAVQLDNDDGSRRISFNNDIIQFQESGIYFLMAAAQVGNLSAQSIGDVHLWMRLNQEDMANSNTIQTIVNKDTGVLVCQTVVVLKAGDQLQLMFSTEVTTGVLGLVATKPPNEPWVPSMIFSAFKSKF